ncbi:restriction endonuclease subunit S [Streptomyces ureilyticus]|uniref:Type I restriction modification DNA specificity domain-containing protein n=1 Tax=Streptomyces ureilyticus TaxID=1775131 RepID=A0ABX0DJB0_9ACTN|nr:restriction endonuclease subunit S [Streptomyces ureilyticus]NGO41935.1 hypothetical protein [Streptomyces ureilyticus]
MTEWITRTIGDIATVFDGPHATPQKTANGPWFLSISSLDNGRLDLEESAHLSESDFKKWTRRVTPQEGDLLFSYETRLGDAALMPAGLQACLGRRMGLLRPYRDRVDPRFLLYTYLGPEFQNEIKARAIHGATVDRIPLVDLPKWPIRVPSLEQQQAVVEILSALDEKLALNKRIATNALSLGRAILKKYIWNENREVAVSDIADLTYGKALPAPKRKAGETPVFGCTGQVGWHDSALTDTACPVVGRKGANAGHVSWMSKPGWVIDTAYHVRPISPDLTAEALYFILESAGFKDLVGDSAVPGVNRHLALRHLIRIPSNAELKSFCEYANNLLKVSVSADTENHTLASLRDTLLPQLVTGKLRIKDAERAVEEAV